MQKNIAIILGVTDYEDPTLDLPACKADVEVVDMVLRIGGHFSEVITIASSDAQTLKAKLAETIHRFQHEDIQDLFFYFTGHGDYTDDGFNYLLRDYSKSRVAATSLANSELDAMLKSLSPKLTIKVVDACYSGTLYIKDGSSFDDYLKSTNTFSNCYFLFSSQSDQRSYADENISDFTYEFARSVTTSSADSIRYKDVIDSISDAFSTRQQQRPLFVSQADFTEVFGIYPEDARNKIETLITRYALDENVLDSTVTREISPPIAVVEPLTLLALVEADAKRYVTLDEARSFAVALKTALEISPQPSELHSIYEISSNWFDDYYSVPNPKTLGDWVKANKEHEYFASPTIGVETYEVESGGINAFFRIAGGESKMVTKTRPVVTGLESAVEGLPFLAYRMILKPRHPNLIQYAAWFTFIISKTTVQVFFSFMEYDEVSWDKYRPGLTTKWERHEFSLTSAGPAAEIVTVFYEKFVAWTTERVKARLAKNASL